MKVKIKMIVQMMLMMISKLNQKVKKNHKIKSKPRYKIKEIFQKLTRNMRNLMKCQENLNQKSKNYLTIKNKNDFK